MVKFRVSAAPNSSFVGQITNIALAADAQSKAYLVKARIDNPRHILKPGMFAEGVVSIGETEGLLIPLEALTTNNNQKTVLVVEDGIARMRAVEVGGQDSQHLLITSGLEEGELVITGGLDTVCEGQQMDLSGSEY